MKRDTEAIAGGTRLEERMEERLIELESRVAFQDDALRKLEELATQQAQQIYRMSQELAAMKERLLAVAPSLLTGQEDEAPPPHY